MATVGHNYYRPVRKGDTVITYDRKLAKVIETKHDEYGQEVIITINGDLLSVDRIELVKAKVKRK